jgi:hypothetical protein
LWSGGKQIPKHLADADNFETHKRLAGSSFF